MGQDSIKNVRSFSRYEYYLLEQAMNGNCWIKLLNEGDSIEALRPLIVPGKGKTGACISVEPYFTTQHTCTA